MNAVKENQALMLKKYLSDADEMRAHLYLEAMHIPVNQQDQIIDEINHLRSMDRESISQVLSEELAEQDERLRY